MLSKDDVHRIAREVVAESKRSSRHDRIAERDERLRNTRILLKEYPKLKAHVLANPDVYLTDDEYKMLTGVEPQPREIAKYHVKTNHMLQYVDQLLDAYKAYCLGGTENDRRRWQIIEDSYLSTTRLTNVKQAEKWGIVESRIRQEQTQAAQELSVMLFGVAGLKDFLDHWLAQD
jgi:hypothetical protein